MWCMQPEAVVGQWTGGRGGPGARTLGLWEDNGLGVRGRGSLFIRWIRVRDR